MWGEADSHATPWQRVNAAELVMEKRRHILSRKIFCAVTPGRVPVKSMVMVRFSVPFRLAVFGVFLSAFLGSPAAARAAGDSMTIEEVRKFQESREGVLLDARGAKFFAKSHIPGAINLPLNDFDKTYERVKARLKPDQRIVVYCSSISCPDSGKLRDKLVKLGYAKVEVFKGGLAAWWKAGLPMEKSADAR